TACPRDHVVAHAYKYFDDVTWGRFAGWWWGRWWQGNDLGQDRRWGRDRGEGGGQRYELDRRRKQWEIVRERDAYGQKSEVRDESEDTRSQQPVQTYACRESNGDDPTPRSELDSTSEETPQK